MIVLPPAIAPPAPFPLITLQSSAPEFVAPGVMRADYRLQTTSGPLVVHVVAIDPHEPTVRLRAVLAQDRMISRGETVSSMAARTNAVAGVNADYFDIGNTNQPLNVVIADGALLRTPSKRVTLQIGANGMVAMGGITFAGAARTAATNVRVTTVNEWPPQGGAALLTPAYGTLTAAPNVSIATLDPISALPGFPGTYRVAGIEPARAIAVGGTWLAFGPALQSTPLPVTGDTLELNFDTEPAAASLAAAVGGGPLLVANGVAVDDPNSPAPEERNVRFPVSGAALAPNGTLLFIAVDGRKPERSIGVTRPEFGALMRGFAAVSGMAFDSGGSATLVARVLGDAAASVVNEPSDGRERPVADGVFVVSSALAGAHPHLIVRPERVTAFAGTALDLSGAVVDDAGHRVRGATLAPVLAGAAGERTVSVTERSGPLVASLHVRSVDRIASLAMVPDRPNPAPGARVALGVRAFDAAGSPVALGNAAVRWTVQGAAPVPFVTTAPALDVAAREDAIVTASVGGATASVPLRVGVHERRIDAFTERALAYDFTGGSRAAYANGELVLPDEPKSIVLDVFGEGSGVGVRAAFRNRFGERVAVTVARRLDWQGWQRQTIVLPPDLNPPVTLLSLYVVPSLGGPPVRGSGTVRFRSLGVLVPGTR